MRILFVLALFFYSAQILATQTADDLQKTIKFTSDNDQLLCLNSTAYPNLIEESNTHTCFMDDGMCFTGDKQKVIDAIYTYNAIATGIEHSLYDVIATLDGIVIEIFDHFSFEYLGAKEEDEYNFVESFKVPHCREIQ